MAQPSIGGVFEVCIGTIDADAGPLIEYWQRFGYHVGERGELSAAEALKLYAVESKLQSVRLYHQDSDHGLIRLFIWEKPKNEGLQLSNMKVIGNRWGMTMTADIYNVENHVEEAISQKRPVFYVPAVRGEIYPLPSRPIPFLDNYAVVREMCLIQPLTRQLLFQRFGYSLPLYGKINDSSYFKTSQITNVGIVIHDDPECVNFYDQVLGLLRGHDGKPGDNTYDEPLSRAIIGLEKGESYTFTLFNDPRSLVNDPTKCRSGRLKVIRFPPEAKLANKLNEANPGSLGYSLYTLRVADIEHYHQKLQGSGATNVTDICKNEFGERSFSFVAPDGYFWTLIEQPAAKVL